MGKIATEREQALAETYDQAQTVWARTGKAEGGEPARVQAPDGASLHDLRHLCASLLIKHRENVKTVQKRLGHAKPSIPLDTYTHLWPDEEDTTRRRLRPSSAMCPRCALLSQPDSVRAGQSS